MLRQGQKVNGSRELIDRAGALRAPLHRGGDLARIHLDADATRVQQMDRLDIIEEVYDIGYRAAKEQILPEHLFGKLDKV